MKKVFFTLTVSKQTYLIGFTTSLKTFVANIHPISELNVISENEIWAYSTHQKQNIMYFAEIIVDNEKCFYKQI